MGIFDRSNHADDKRLHMVQSQLRSRGIADERVLKAMSVVPRERFVRSEYTSEAYKDGPLPIDAGQTISQPYMVALMTECLDLNEDDKVLEIGTGSGYQTAVLLEITPHVYSLERISVLAEKAIEKLTSLGYENFTIQVGDGSCGWPDEAPFDAIIVTSAAPSVPSSLKEQLADLGRLVIPVGPRHSQVLYKIIKKGDDYITDEQTPCVFVPLVGKYGWEEEP